MLVRNTSSYEKVIPVRAAVWKENRDINICDPGTGHTAFRTQESGASVMRTAGAAQGITVDKIMADFDLERIDLLKLDIEGAEKDVFDHSQSWISRVGAIAVEVHDWILPGSTESVRSATREFKYEWRQDDVTFFARNENSRRIKRNPDTSNHFPLKILSTY